MGLLEQEIMELRQMNKQVMAGTIKPEEVDKRIAIYSQTEKRAKMILQAHALAAKGGARAIKGIIKHNLIGRDTPIGSEAELGGESIMCPDMNRTIVRDECLEYSGEADNFNDCSSCPHFPVTRRLLLGD